MSLKLLRANLLKYSVLLGLLVLSLATFSYFFIDQYLSTYFNNEHLMPYRKIAKAVTDIGLGQNSFLIAIVTFVLFSFGDKKWIRRHWMGNPWQWLKSWSINYLLALIFSGLIGNLFKLLIGRQRPHVSDTFDPNLFTPINFDSHHQSLPSGHSQVLFCSATMLSILWPRQAWLIYPLAAVLTFTRVIVHAHFLSDVLAGALVGHLGTLWCLWLIQKYSPAKYSLSSRP